jgi:hypothetical protein
MPHNAPQASGLIAIHNSRNATMGCIVLCAGTDHTLGEELPNNSGSLHIDANSVMGAAAITR